MSKVCHECVTGIQNRKQGKKKRSGLVFQSRIHTHSHACERSPLGGEDAVDDRFSPVRRFNHEHVADDVEDEIELGHGAHQLGLQEGRPLLLQSSLTTQIPLRFDRKSLN